MIQSNGIAIDMALLTMKLGNVDQYWLFFYLFQ